MRLLIKEDAGKKMPFAGKKFDSVHLHRFFYKNYINQT